MKRVSQLHCDASTTANTQSKCCWQLFRIVAAAVDCMIDKLCSIYSEPDHFQLDWKVVMAVAATQFGSCVVKLSMPSVLPKNITVQLTSTASPFCKARQV